MLLLIIAIVWFLGATYSAGTSFAYFQTKYAVCARENSRKDMAFAWGCGLFFGPIGAIVIFFWSGFNEYGWRLW